MSIDESKVISCKPIIPLPATLPKNSAILERYKLQNPGLSYEPDLQIPIGQDNERTMPVRVNQDFFRQAVLTSYEGMCCITGIPIPALLNASHIKPWRDSDPQTERTNPKNGLCLNALHDRAFDRGLITIDNDFRIILSSQLKEAYSVEAMDKYFYKNEGKQIRLPHRFAPAQEFIEYHNEHIFVK